MPKKVVCVSSIQLLFLQKVVRQSNTNVASFCMQFDKIGCGLSGVRGSALFAEREGEIRKDWSWKTELNIEGLRVNKNECSVSNCVGIFPRILHLCFPRLILSYFPHSFGQQGTPLHCGKLPAVTHVLSYQTACEMMSRWCDFAWWLSAKKTIVYYCVSNYSM